MKYTTPTGEIEVLDTGHSFKVSSPYNKNFVDLLKITVPQESREFDGKTKAWFISYAYAQQITNMLKSCYGVNIPLSAPGSAPALEVEVLTLHYLGACKDRGAGESSALGWVNNGWNSVFPESVLRFWFEGTIDNTSRVTLYSVLGCKIGDPQEAIKSAYKRLARQYHPDLNREPDAAERFRELKAAYDVLGDERARTAYNVGLEFEQALPRGSRPAPVALYRAPLRCGYVLAEVEKGFKKSVVKSIMGWEDITDAAGRVLVSSWPAGSEYPVLNWS